jgi:hypothetical protein
MYKDLEKYDLTKFTDKFIAQVRQKRQLGGIAQEFDCRGASSVTVPIFSAGMAKPHVPGDRIPDFGGKIDKTQISTEMWDAADHLDYFLLDQVNFNYESAVERTLIPAAVCNRMDQIVIDKLNEPGLDDKGKEIVLPTISYNSDLLAMFADIKALMDSEEKYIPLEDRFLVMPAEAEPEFFTNDKFMSNDYIQLQMSNISDGKIGRIMGMQIIFLNNIPTGGLKRVPMDGGANLLWDCYAVSKVCMCQAVGYGGDRSADGKGGVFIVKDDPVYGGIFINAPFAYGAKVLIPEGVVRFNVKTKNYQSVA